MKSQVLITTSLVALAAHARAQAPLYDISGAVDDRLGASLTSLGDVDGDGHADIASGAPDGNGLQAHSGRVLIHSGKTGALLRALDGEKTGDRFGHSVADVGDIDGDGKHDLAVGAPRYDEGGFVDRGAAYVFSGATGAQLWKTIGGSGGNLLGAAVAGPGDLDGDGRPEIAVAAPMATVVGPGAGAGIVLAYSSSTFLFVRGWWGQVANEQLGHSLAAGGDVNGDGTPDLVAGAPFANNGLVLQAGRVRVLSGATHGGIVVTFNGAATGGLFGNSVAVVPDVNGDGRAEFAVGEPGYKIASQTAGRAVVLGTPSWTTLLNVFGANAEELGWSIAALPDVDGDGRADLLVGLPGYDNGTVDQSGLTRAYSIATQSQIPVIAQYGYTQQARMGSSVASAGDVNGDGWGDMVAGSPGDQVGIPDGGRVRADLGNAPAPLNYCTAKVNSDGCSPGISYGGCASLSTGMGILVVGANILPNALGAMIWSVQPNGAPFGGGTLCVKAPIKRTPVQSTSFDPDYPCTGVFTYLMDGAYLSANGITAGMDVYCQYWYRDNGFAPPNNMGLTNGLQVRVHP